MCFFFVLQTDQDHNIFKKLSAENIDSENGWVSTWMWATHYHMWATHTHWWATHRHWRSTQATLCKKNMCMLIVKHCKSCLI